MSYLLYYSYFINDGDYSFPAELNMEKNNITTFYSLIPNKHRKTPINYFKYSDIKNITNIEKAEKIRQSVNTYISQINTYIAEANSYFDDDNFIVSLGLADWGSRNHPSFNFYVLPLSVNKLDRRRVNWTRLCSYWKTLFCLCDKA